MRIARNRRARLYEHTNIFDPYKTIQVILTLTIVINNTFFTVF